MVSGQTIFVIAFEARRCLVSIEYCCHPYPFRFVSVIQQLTRFRFLRILQLSNGFSFNTAVKQFCFYDLDG